MFSLLILSFVLLGIDAAEIDSLRTNNQAYLFSVAENQMQVIIERLRGMNRQVYVDEQVKIWNEQNHEVLPQGIGQVHGSYPLFDISLFGVKKSAHQFVMKCNLKK